MTPAQLTALKTFIDGDPALSAIPNSADGHIAVAAILNGIVAPDYWVWKPIMFRAEIYNSVGDNAGTPTTWSWTIYKNQPVTEQGTWREMFTDDQLNVGQLNNRVGVGALFTAGSLANATHFFAVGRRRAKIIEKLFAAAVLSPPANSGNNAAQPRGSAANPDVVVIETVSVANVEKARSL